MSHQGESHFSHKLVMKMAKGQVLSLNAERQVSIVLWRTEVYDRCVFSLKCVSFLRI